MKFTKMKPQYRVEMSRDDVREAMADWLRKRWVENDWTSPTLPTKEELKIQGSNQIDMITLVKVELEW